MDSFDNPSHSVWLNLCISTKESVLVQCHACRPVTRYQNTHTRVTHTCQNYVNKYAVCLQGNLSCLLPAGSEFQYFSFPLPTLIIPGIDYRQKATMDILPAISPFLD